MLTGHLCLIKVFLNFFQLRGPKIGMPLVEHTCRPKSVYLTLIKKRTHTSAWRPKQMKSGQSALLLVRPLDKLTQATSPHKKRKAHQHGSIGHCHHHFIKKQTIKYTLLLPQLHASKLLDKILFKS